MGEFVLLMSTIVATKSEPVQEVEQNEPAKTQGSGTVSVGKQKDIPLEIYNQENSYPYIYELLDVDQTLPDEFRDQLGVIDDYIHQKIEQEGYRPTTEGYKAMFNKVQKELGINENTILEIGMDRIAKYVDAERTLKAIKSMDSEKILRLLKKSKTKDISYVVLKELEKKVVKV